MKASLTGILSKADRNMLSMNVDEILLYEQQIQECCSEMIVTCKEYCSMEVKLLQTIPDIKENSAMSIITEIGVDMKAFATAVALVGWAGLRPRNDHCHIFVVIYSSILQGTNRVIMHLREG